VSKYLSNEALKLQIKVS